MSKFPLIKEYPESPAIYKLSIDGLYYIGCTENIKRRLCEHFWELRSGTHPNPRLLDSYNTSGEKSLDFKVTLREDYSKEQLLEEEKELIMRNVQDYNMTNVVAGDLIRVGGFPDEIITMSSRSSDLYQQLPEDVKEYIKRSCSLKNKERWKKLSSEEREKKLGSLRSAFREYSDSLSSEERRKIGLKGAKTRKEIWDGLTDEERAARVEKRTIGINKHYQEMSAVEKEKRKEFFREKIGKPVTVDMIWFNSIGTLADLLRLTKDTVRSRFRRDSMNDWQFGLTPGAISWEDLKENQKETFIKTHSKLIKK